MDNKRMCTVDEFDHGLYDDNDDDLGGLIRNILDFPVESLDGGDDDLSDDWASELGPIPSEVFGDILPPVGVGNTGGCSGGSGGGGSTSFLTECDSKVYRVPKSFEAPSPDSVLVRRISSSARKSVLFGPEIAVPVRARTKRLRSRLQSGPGLSTWSKSLQQFPFQKMKKKKKNLPKHDVNEVNKCTHCGVTKTPQWREGPMGPKTLCNACGVRYRSGRLFPEYRPAASPTFVPSLHSNWHRKVVEMRQGGSHG